MKHFLIYLSVFTILFIAFLDAGQRMAELSLISVETPSQTEMKDKMNTRKIKSYSLDTTRNNERQKLHDKMRNNTKQNLQNSINDMNNRQQSKQVR